MDLKTKVDVILWDTNRGEAKRPFRLWDARKKRQVQWRCYSDAKRAHNAALMETRWANVGDTIEVFDIRTGALLGQYTRKVASVGFRA